MSMALKLNNFLFAELNLGGPKIFQALVHWNGEWERFHTLHTGGTDRCQQNMFGIWRFADRQDCKCKYEYREMNQQKLNVILWRRSFELGNGHFLILICQNRKQHRQIVKVYVSTTRRLYVKN